MVEQINHFMQKKSIKCECLNVFFLQFSCFQQPHFDVRNNLRSSKINCKLTVAHAQLYEQIRIYNQESSQNIDAISAKILLFIIDCVLISRAGISHQKQQAASSE